MSLISGLLLPFCTAAALVSVAGAQTKEAPQLTPRELFYDAVQRAPAVAAAKPAPKTSAPTPPKTQTAAVQKGSGVKQTAATEVAAARPDPPVSRPTPSTRPSTSPDGTQIVTASTRKTAPAPTAGPALGLKYTVLKRVGKEMVPVAADSQFHTGDRIQVKVESSAPGYLYIISKGSSGTWKVRFPSSEIENGDNRVEVLRPYYFPAPDAAFTFDEQKGTEKLFIILSREPVPDVQDQIYGLQGGKTAPVSQPQPSMPRQQPLLVEARLNFPESKIGQMRSLYARDLIIEKVTPDTPEVAGTPADKKEFAVYVVNPSGSPDSRLAADIGLVHE